MAGFSCACMSGKSGAGRWKEGVAQLIKAIVQCRLICRLSFSLRCGLLPAKSMWNTARAVHAQLDHCN